MLLRSNETRIMYVKQTICVAGKRIKLHSDLIIPAAKHGGGSVMPQGKEKLVRTDQKMDEAKKNQCLTITLLWIINDFELFCDEKNHQRFQTVTYKTGRDVSHKMILPYLVWGWMQLLNSFIQTASYFLQCHNYVPLCVGRSPKIPVKHTKVSGCTVEKSKQTSEYF